MTEEQLKAARRERGAAIFMRISLESARAQGRRDGLVQFEDALTIQINIAERLVQAATAKIMAAGQAVEAPLLMMGGEA